MRVSDKAGRGLFNAGPNRFHQQWVNSEGGDEVVVSLVFEREVGVRGGMYPLTSEESLGVLWYPLSSKGR